MTRGDAIRQFLIKSVLPAAARLHFQIRLRKRRRDGLFPAVDSLRSALRSASDVPLDHSGQQILWRQYCHIRVQLHHRRYHRWICPGLASDRRSLVCSSDRLPIDRWITTGRKPNGK